jgi:hypothetical protein
MIEKSELRRIPTFQGLPDDQLDWFISQTEEIRLKPGDVYLQLGDLASSMVVILEGELQARGDINGEVSKFIHDAVERDPNLLDLISPQSSSQTAELVFHATRRHPELVDLIYPQSPARTASEPLSTIENQESIRTIEPALHSSDLPTQWVRVTT